MSMLREDEPHGGESVDSAPLLKSGEEKEAANKAFTKVTIWVVPVLFLISFVCYVDRSNLSLAGLELKSDLGISETEYGIAVGLFYIPYLLLQVPSNLALQRVGPPRWFAILLIGWGCSASLSSLIQNKTQLYVLRFALGLFESGTFPGVLYYLSLFYPETRVSFPVGLTVAGSVLGVCLSAPMAAVLFLMDGWLGWEGWRWLLFWEGIPAILLGFLVLWYLPKSPEHLFFLTARENAAMLKEIQGESGKSEPMPFLTAMWSILRTWRLWFLLIFWTMGTICILFGIFWGPDLVQAVVDRTNFRYIDEKSASGPKNESNIALLTAIPNVFGAIAMVYIGWSSSKFKERRFHAGIPSVIGGLAFFLLAPLARVNRVLGFMALSFASMGAVSFSGPLTSLEITYMTEGNRAVGIAWSNAFLNIFGFFGPTLFGRLIDSSLSYVGCMQLSGSLLIIAGIGYMFMKDDHGDHKRN